MNTSLIYCSVDTDNLKKNNWKKISNFIKSISQLNKYEIKYIDSDVFV